jgi:hypothetical protein
LVVRERSGLHLHRVSNCNQRATPTSFAKAFQALLQRCDVELPGWHAGGQRQRCSRSGRLAHGEARA